MTASQHLLQSKSGPRPFDLSPIASADGDHRVYFHSSETMTELADDCVQLSVFSPPYGIGIRYYREDQGPTAGQVEGPVRSMEEYEAYVDRQRPIYRETARVTAPGGYVVLNIAPIHSKAEFFGESFMFPIVEDLSHIWRKEIGFQNRWKYYWITTRTSNNSKGDSQAVLGSYPMPLEGQVIRAAEEWLVFRKPGGRKLTEERMERRRRSKLTLQQWRQTFSQWWTTRGVHKEQARDGTIHMAPYPIELVERVIRGYSCIGDTVLDPFLGTGTTMLAARRLGRKSVGYEVEAVWRDLIIQKTGILGPSVGRPSTMDQYPDEDPG